MYGMCNLEIIRDKTLNLFTVFNLKFKKIAFLIFSRSLRTLKIFKK